MLYADLKLKAYRYSTIQYYNTYRVLYCSYTQPEYIRSVSARYVRVRAPDRQSIIHTISIIQRLCIILCLPGALTRPH